MILKMIISDIKNMVYECLKTKRGTISIITMIFMIMIRPTYHTIYYYALWYSVWVIGGNLALQPYWDKAINKNGITIYDKLEKAKGQWEK